MPELRYDSWFRTKVLPIAADEDGHVVAANLNVCVQGLFGAGKSRAAAILLLGLMALDTEGECHFQVICKENTGTRSFIEMVEYLQFPTELYQCIGRIVSDREAQNAASTYFDIRHSAKIDRLPKCRLLVMTGGSFANDRCSTFPALDAFLSKLMITIFDEAQQFGGDREVTTVAMLPPTCLVVWMGDAQQTPGGIAKGHDQFAISRRQLMMRKHGLRCPQTDVTPHSLSTVLCALLQEVDDPSATALAEVLASANSNLGPLWVDHPNQDQSATLDILDTFCLEGMSDGKPHPPRISKTTHNRQMFLLGRHVTQLHYLLLLTFVLSWIVPKNGSLTYRPKIHCPRQVRLGYMHGGSCFPPVHARQAFATHALLRSGMTHCAHFFKTPKPGALAHTRAEV